MNCADCISQLDAYVDGELTPAATHELEQHLAGCDRCRRELAALRTLLARTAALPRQLPPSRELWADIAAACRANHPAAPATRGFTSAGPADTVLQSWRAIFSWSLPVGVAAAIAFMMTWAERQPALRATPRGWSVTALAGAPLVDAKPITAGATLPIGQWLETDGQSRAEVSTSAIGRVTVDPNSRLRVAPAHDTDQRLELARGALSAFIWAPPRIFFVDTPSATAVDLGCAYTLKVDDEGDGELEVTLGYVALEHGAREAIIPAGAMCLTRRGAGPGTPFAKEAGTGLRTALTEFDFHAGGTSALKQILATAGAQDAVTLWHLLARTAGDERGAVFDALAKHHAPPAGVTRAGILAGDAAMRTAWAESLGLGTFGRP